MNETRYRPEVDAKLQAAQRETLRRRLFGAVAVVLGVALVVGAVVVAQADRRTSPQSATSQPPGAGSPFGPHYEALSQRRSAAGIPTMMDTMSSPVHVHPQLQVWINGKQVPVPANIGIDPAKDPMQMAGLHTHDTSGTIHVEGVAHATLGAFFAVWGVPFTAQQLGPYKTAGARRVRMWVNGSPSSASGHLKLADGQRIVISYSANPAAP